MLGYYESHLVFTVNDSEPLNGDDGDESNGIPKTEN
jgi:hypothetical protein